MAQEKPKNFYAEELDLTGPPDMRKVERLAQILAQSRVTLSELNAELAVITEDDRDMWVNLLRELKIGDLPFDLPQRLRDDVKALEEEWASEASLTALKGKLASFLRPLYQEDESLKLDEKELDLEGERLATLKMLADLLDELLKSKPDVPTEEISAEAFPLEEGSNSPDQTGSGGKT
jgi:hypothetical protein